MHIRRLFLAILAISFFWTIGAVLIIIFPPLVKNVLGADEQVASLFIAIFSIGIAIGSVLINRLLKSEVSARFAPASVIAMGVFVLLLHFVALAWGKNDPGLTTLGNFLLHPMAGLMIVALLGVAITGGMFVVPLYAFLTTTVPKTETARTVAANNIVNSGAMVDRLADRVRAEHAPASARSVSCCWSRRCAWSRHGSAGSSTWPATEPLFSRSGSRRTGTRRAKVAANSLRSSDSRAARHGSLVAARAPARARRARIGRERLAGRAAWQNP